MREELGIVPPIGRLLVADWWAADVDDPARSKLLLVFDGAILGESEQEMIQVDGQEVIDFGFVAPAEFDSVTIPRLANRIRVALGAAASGATCYLENGQLIH